MSCVTRLGRPAAAASGVIRALVRSTKMPSKRASSATFPGSTAKACLRGRAQKPPMRGVADQRLVAALELSIERGEYHAPLGGILGCLGLLVGDDGAHSRGAYLS